MVHAGHVALSHCRMIHLRAIHCSLHVGATTTFRAFHAGTAGAFHAPHAGHAAMTHVGHGQQRTNIQRRHRRLQSGTRRQRGARITAAIHGLGEDRVGLFFLRRDQYIESLGHADAEFVDRYRMHRLAVGADHGQFQTRDAHVEESHRRAVDETQPHFLATLEQAGPVAVRRDAVDQVGIGDAVDVGQVGGAHAHRAPGLAVGHGRFPAVASRVAEQVAHGLLVPVVVVGLDLELADDGVRVFIAPVGQQHHVVAVGGDRDRRRAARPRWRRTRPWPPAGWNGRGTSRCRPASAGSGR